MPVYSYIHIYTQPDYLSYVYEYTPDLNLTLLMTSMMLINMCMYIHI